MTGDAATDIPIIRADNVVRTFKIGQNRIEVLRGVTLSVKRGEKLFLSGASGAGKTSLLYTLAGLEAPNEGKVFVEENSIYDLPRHALARCRSSQMGYVFQNYFLLPELTAAENVMLPAMMRGKNTGNRAEELLEKVGLRDRATHLPTELSGGEQQRVAIARALINDPDIIFADEPTGNLDSKTGASVMDLLMNLVDEQHKTLMVVTHDPSLAESGDRKLELFDGRLVA